MTVPVTRDQPGPGSRRGHGGAGDPAAVAAGDFYRPVVPVTARVSDRDGHRTGPPAGRQLQVKFMPLCHGGRPPLAAAAAVARLAAAAFHATVTQAGPAAAAAAARAGRAGRTQTFFGPGSPPEATVAATSVDH